MTKRHSTPPHSRVYAALLELVECKDLKDSTEADFYADEPMLTTDQRNECRAEYERRKPLAWEAARKVLTECVPSETGVREAIIEECAALIDPAGEPPCGCFRPGSYGGCECSNTGNLQQEEAYWSSKGDAERIRGLKGKP